MNLHFNTSISINMTKINKLSSISPEECLFVVMENGSIYEVEVDPTYNGNFNEDTGYEYNYVNEWNFIFTNPSEYNGENKIQIDDPKILSIYRIRKG